MRLTSLTTFQNQEQIMERLIFDLKALRHRIQNAEYKMPANASFKSNLKQNYLQSDEAEVNVLG